ncbi:hypothetical protein AGR4C_Lc120111 [Agrobacterium tumefaciens str. Kerr 14]|uniref:Uncharacterized protein n=1 Tax=Agrobacterium tumefaciens str. Kerr 14 TaxID=1183424 RepID=A0A1S7R914_AGRTU|nr:hypothetical protein AGR4C_Lc120111 [Agrobacterium tumefaciens str. Kerr 14]
MEQAGGWSTTPTMFQDCRTPQMTVSGDRYSFAGARLQHDVTKVARPASFQGFWRRTT